MNVSSDFDVLTRLNTPGHDTAVAILEQAKERLRELGGLSIQAETTGGAVTPYWGLLEEARARLPEAHVARIRDVITFKEGGDAPKPEAAIIRLKPADYFEVNGRCIRAFKLKGVSPQIPRVKKRERRHIRLLGHGDTPTLVPYLSAKGDSRPVPFDVGEPWGGKRIRGVVNEMLMDRIAYEAGCAVMVPVGIGIYDEPDLLFKGEPIGFSIWGIEHPDDVRFIHEWTGRVTLDKIRLTELGSAAGPAHQNVLSEGLRWTRQRLARILEEARKYHALGLVHHEPQLDNHAFQDESLTVLDWEEAAHARQLTRAQFIESVLIDLYKLVAFACILEAHFRHASEQLKTAPSNREASSGFAHANWFMCYFGEDGRSIEAPLKALLPVRLTDGKRRGEFRRVVLPLIERLYGDMAFGDGVDWEAVARPYLAGFSHTAPKWTPDASTTFDAKLFVRSGSKVPGSDRVAHPTPEIEAAERALREGRFEDSQEAYQAILRDDAGAKAHGQYIHHNLASLCFALRRDEDGELHFRKAYGDGRSGP